MSHTDMVSPMTLAEADAIMPLVRLLSALFNRAYSTRILSRRVGRWAQDGRVGSAYS